MKINGYDIERDQESTVLSAMVGTFRARDLETIGEKLGIPRVIPRPVGRGGLLVLSRFVDALLQRERRAGRIKHIGGGAWQKL